MADDPDGVSRYGTARIAAALALVGCVVFMLMVDPILPEYQADPVVITTVLGAGAALLGVEILDVLRRGRS